MDIYYFTTFSPLAQVCLNLSYYTDAELFELHSILDARFRFFYSNSRHKNNTYFFTFDGLEFAISLIAPHVLYVQSIDEILTSGASFAEKKQKAKKTLKKVVCQLDGKNNA